MVSCSLWSADLGSLSDAIEKVNDLADAFHFDVMDGRFVKNFLFGADTIRTLREKTNKPFEVHLMVEKPENYLEMFAEAGADYLIVHPEACQNLGKTLKAIEDLGVKPGVALNPNMPIKVIEPFLSSLELVLILCVVPGFRNQPFIPDTLNKIRELKNLLQATDSSVIIEADGAIRNNTVPPLVEAGTDIVVGGSIVFRQPDPHKSLAWLHDLRLLEEKHQIFSGESAVESYNQDLKLCK